MNIYIPKHIRNIGVVGKMCDLIEAYNKSGMYVDNTENSLGDYYYYYLKVDPIIRFLHIAISETKWREEHPTEDYESVISYLSRLFYSTKGTYKVFDYIQRYLGLEITDIKYTVKTLSFRISEITLTEIDEKVYYDSLLDFLGAFLYFTEVNIEIGKVNLWLSNSLSNYTGASIITYKEYYSSYGN